MTFAVRRLEKSIGGRHILSQLSLQVRGGQIVGILGPNGSGKSTAFHVMIGLLRADGGEILLDGQNMTHLPCHRRSAMGLGYLAQGSHIFRNMTVRGNLLAVMECVKVPRSRRRTLLHGLCERFHITAILEQKGAVLSGGERRRVEVARLLITQPQFLLLDEPFAGVDPLSIGQMQRMLQELRAEGKGILITDHNAHEMLAFCDRIYVLHSGQVMAEGTPEEVVAHERVQQTYLGESFTLSEHHD